MEESVKKFLKNVGVDGKVITQFNDPPEDLDVDKLVDEFKQGQRDVYANDPDVIKDLQAKAKGKERGSVEREIRRVFSITPEEVGEHDLEGDYKKHLEFSKKKTEKSGNKSADKIQIELQEKNKELEQVRNEEIPALKVKAQKEIDVFYVEKCFQKLINSEEIGELIIANEDATTIITGEFEKLGYTLSLTEGRKDIIIKTKDGLVPQDSGKTRNLTNMEVTKSILESKKLVRQSNADDDEPPKPKLVSGFPEPQKQNIEVENQLPGLRKARAHEKELKNIEFSKKGDVFRK